MSLVIGTLVFDVEDDGKIPSNMIPRTRGRAKEAHNMPQEKRKKILLTVQTVHESEESLAEIRDYLDKSGKSAGKAYVEAMHVYINREKKAGRWGV
jgi:hypothetical protein